MPGTKRRPLNRPSTGPLITPKAVAVFKQLERARRARRQGVGCTLSKYGLCNAECAACEAWWNAHNELCDELRLKPWQWPCVPRCPFPLGTPAARVWRPGADQQALWAALDQARRAFN